MKGLEAQLTFSTSIASKAGVEEAIMYQALLDLAPLFAEKTSPASLVASAQSEHHIPRSALEKRLPFWQTSDLQRLLSSLTNSGLITQLSSPLPQVDYLSFGFGRRRIPNRVQPSVHRAIRSPNQQGPQNRALPIGQQWRPDASTFVELERLGYSKESTETQIPGFIQYFREKGELGFNWNQKFKAWVRRTQVQAQQAPKREIASFEQTIREPTPMTSDWRPDPEAMHILLRDHVDPQFIEDAIPEFVLFWRERGEVHKTWSSKFVSHVQRQWLRYQNEVQHSRVPQAISEHWQPDQNVFDILAMANIDEAFAKQWVQEFVLYWRESGKVHTSWNSKYLQFIKQKWSQRLNHHGVSGSTPTSHHHAAANAQAQLTDTSWAD